MQVLSSLSSIPFYAPSAGFAPTNSADVSAIASAYAESAASGKLDKTAQVVTAIGTGWNSDDDEIVSAVNGCILSADEARYAGAATISNYAYYDRRLNAPGRRSISSLPGSAEVSAIASAYAESAASSKQDALTFGYDDDKISSINGSSLAGGGGVDSATVSAIASSYSESAASSKVDISSNNNIQISAKGLIISGGTAITARYGNNMAVLQTSPIQRMYLSDLGSDKRVDIYKSGISGNDGGIWQYGTAEYGNLTSVYDTVSANSATWGAAGVDSAACSAIASAYAESAVSSYVPYSSLEYNTASAISGINGSALAAGSTYSAGEGIDITDDVISVEAPVDIVAGPGIVIDNPDGNTLRVSQSTFGAWENITDQFTWASNATDNGVRCLYNTTLKLLWMQGYVHLNVGTSSTKVCTLPSSLKTQLRISELSMASTLEEKHGLLSTNLDRTELHFKWVTAPSNKYVGFFLICPMEEV